MTELRYHRATVADVEVLTETRAIVLHAANKLPADVAIPQEIYDNAREFYARAIADGTHVAYLVFDGDKVVGAGGVTFFQLIPFYYNRTGRCAQVVNMYTHPDYRRRGVAWKTLDLIVAEVRSRGLISVGLEATDMGMPLYEKYGFEMQNHEMRLDF